MTNYDTGAAALHWETLTEADKLQTKTKFINSELNLIYLKLSFYLVFSFIQYVRVIRIGLKDKLDFIDH